METSKNIQQELENALVKLAKHIAKEGDWEFVGTNGLHEVREAINSLVRGCIGEQEPEILHNDVRNYLRTQILGRWFSNKGEK